MIEMWTLMLAHAAGVATPTGPVPIKSFEERILKEVPTSGVFVVSVMAADAKRPIKPEAIYVALPQSHHTRLCVQVKAIDALYQADGEFDISQTSAGIWDLAFTPELIEFDAYSNNEIVVDARLGDDCANSTNAAQVLSAWTHDAIVETTLRLFLNTDGSDGFVLAPTIDDDKIRSFECTRLSSERRVRLFGKVCEIVGADQVNLNKGWVELRRFGREVDWEALNISRYAGQQ